MSKIFVKEKNTLGTKEFVIGEYGFENKTILETSFNENGDLIVFVQKEREKYE